jgi:hypothetical protein
MDYVKRDELSVQLLFLSMAWVFDKEVQPNPRTHEIRKSDQKQTIVKNDQEQIIFGNHS